MILHFKKYNQKTLITKTILSVFKQLRRRYSLVNSSQDQLIGLRSQNLHKKKCKFCNLPFSITSGEFEKREIKWPRSGLKRIKRKINKPPK